MTNRRKERDRARRKRRKVREADERRREERNRRFDELVEAWRRNHPGEHEEDRKDLPTRGRMFFGRDLTICTKARCLHPRRVRRRSFPEPPETIKALTRARNRAAALDTACGGGLGLFPYEREALLERGELVPHSLVAALVAGREPGEPLEDLSE